VWRSARTDSATQLLNAGCRITSIQAFLGHKKLNTTLIYARAYDQTVADDYFTAMRRVEQRMEIAPVRVEEKEHSVVKVPEKVEMLAWVERLALPELCPEERLDLAEKLKWVLGLAFARLLVPP
jgi:hypothetical protein